MEIETQVQINEIFSKLAKLQAEIEFLKRKEENLEKKKFILIDESMGEIWDNEEDDVWNGD